MKRIQKTDERTAHFILFSFTLAWILDSLQNVIALEDHPLFMPVVNEQNHLESTAVSPLHDSQLANNADTFEEQQDLQQEVLFGGFSNDYNMPLLVPNEMQFGERIDSSFLNQQSGAVNIGEADNGLTVPPLQSMVYGGSAGIGGLAVVALLVVGATVAALGSGNIGSGTDTGDIQANIPQTAPTAIDDKVISWSDNSGSIFIPVDALFKNDVNLENDPLMLAGDLSNFVNLQFIGISNGIIEFKPTNPLPINDADEVIGRFEYKVTDNAGGSDSAMVTVDIRKQSLGGQANGSDAVITGSSDDEIILVNNNKQKESIYIDGIGGNDFIQADSNTVGDNLVITSGASDDMIFLTNNFLNLSSGDISAALRINNTGGRDMIVMTDNTVLVSGDSYIVSGITSTGHADILFEDNHFFDTVTINNVHGIYVNIKLTNTTGDDDTLQINNNKIQAVATNPTIFLLSRLAVTKEESGVLSNDIIQITGNTITSYADAGTRAYLFDTSIIQDSLVSHDQHIINDNVLHADDYSKIQIFRRGYDDTDSTDTVSIKNNFIQGGDEATIFGYGSLADNAKTDTTIIVDSNQLSSGTISNINFVLASTSSENSKTNLALSNNILMSDKSYINFQSAGNIDETVTITDNTLNSVTLSSIYVRTSSGDDTITVEGNTLNAVTSKITIIPGTGDDTIDLGLTNTLTGAISTRVIFNQGDGSDTIMHFDALDDDVKIDFNGLTPVDWNALVAITGAVMQVGADVIIDLSVAGVGGNAGDGIALIGVTLSDLDNNDFIF